MIGQATILYNVFQIYTSKIVAAWSPSGQWVNSLWPGQTGQYVVNTLRRRQNRRHLADDIFKSILLIENVLIAITISQKFIPTGPINNIPSLVQIMAWSWPGDKPLSEPVMVTIVYWRIYASLGLKELKHHLIIQGVQSSNALQRLNCMTGERGWGLLELSLLTLS